MNSSLRMFVREFGGVVVATLAPVILVAFLTIPLMLGGHPGETRAVDTPVVQHMT
jgi:hypothetical protein